jgi:hypothetical protein
MRNQYLACAHNRLLASSPDCEVRMHANGSLSAGAAVYLQVATHYKKQ